MLALLGLQLLTGLFVVDIDRLYPIRLAITGVIAVVALRHVGLTPPRGFVPWLAGAGVFGLWWWLAARPAPEVVDAARSALEGLSPLERGTWVVARIAGSVIVVPIVEELAFRRRARLPWPFRASPRRGHWCAHG